MCPSPVTPGYLAIQGDTFHYHNLELESLPDNQWVEAGDAGEHVPCTGQLSVQNYLVQSANSAEVEKSGSDKFFQHHFWPFYLYDALSVLLFTGFLAPNLC